MKITFEKIVIAFIFITGIALLTVLVLFYFNTKKIKLTSDLVEQAQGVINKSDNVLVDVLNIETGSRGYSLTGNEVFLQPFNVGYAAINYDVEALVISVEGNPNQQLRVDLLKKAVEEILVFTNNSIEERKEQIIRVDSLKKAKDKGFVFAKKSVEDRRKSAETKKASSIVTDRNGKMTADKIRSILTDINSEELGLLKGRKIENEIINKNSELIFLTLIILILALVAAIIKNHYTRNKIEKELKISTLTAERATQKSEESSKLKEAFLANMSHEIRTPMNAIIGFSDILSKGELNKKEKEYVKIIKSAGENLLTIINDILDMSKIEAGMMTFEAHTFSIKEIFKSLNVMLLGKAKEKNLQLLFICNEDIPDGLLGDSTRLTQVIINIVGNAIKFTQKGSINVFAAILKNENENIWLKFEVKDTGIGIPPDKLEHIFERFRQAESQTTRKYGGTGLGLSIAKQLVELQGGSLSVKSKLNVGSVFSFSIPYKKSTEVLSVREDIVKKYNIEELSKLNILLVEDNPLNVKLILSLFSEYNLKVQVAENGSMGIEKLKENQFNIILMDMEMPVMNGYEATSFIRKELNNKIPIIAMTAHAMAGEREKCLSLGMNAYISKPINVNLLFEKIHDLTLNS